MEVSLVKKALESDESFQYWKEAIGLSFEDFDILELVENDTKFLILKEGKKDIGKYSIQIKDGVVDCFCFGMANESVRQHTLKLIGYDKAS
jgi:hypothetical protein